MPINIRLISILIMVTCFCLSANVFAGVQKSFQWAVESNNLSDVSKFLARGADPNTPNRYSYTPLMVAAQTENIKLAELLLHADAKLDVRNNYGETAIMLASYHGLTEMVKQLYVKGAEINHSGWNPLLYAASNGHTHVMQLLLNGGAEINATSDNGTTAVMMAVRGNHYKAVSLLIENGADPRIRNEQGENALHWAQKHNHRKIIKFLSDHNAMHE